MLCKHSFAKKLSDYKFINLENELKEKNNETCSARNW